MRITMGIDEAFARAVSGEMARQHVSIAWLAANAGIPNRTLRHILAADQHVKLTHVRRIAHALGFESSDLVAQADRLATR